MSPGTRKLIENAFLALLDSGIDYRSRTVGCFASSTNHPVTNISDMNEYEVEGSFAGVPAMVANKISYHLDLLGPSVPTDTACSSSATALHLAVNALKQGDCEAAVVAGAQINNSFIDWFLYSQGSVLAPDGKCKPFDASADGFSRAEGVVAIVIKPLQRALDDGDYIYGTIMGSAINTGGNAAPPAAPIPGAQRRAMQNAFERAGLLPTDVDYVECHATGTSAGDPAEANWIAKNFGRDDDTLFIGSVKGNIGHSEITAFLASLSKVVSMFRHQIIPPNVNLTRPNPAIPWKEYNMVAPTISTTLPCRSGNQSIVAIASSGIGGSNAHVVVQGPPPHTIPSVQSQEWPILVLAGGLSPRTATVMASRTMELALAHPEKQRLLAVKSARRTRQMVWRTFVILDALAPGSKVPHFPAPIQCPRTKPPIVFVFSGQGPQHVNMGRQFFSVFPAFRTSVLESDEVFKARTGYSLVDDIGLFGNKPPKDDLEEWPIHITLPALLIFQIALYDLLLDLGVRPDVLIGHSAGETALVYASQAGSRALAVELAIARGQAFSAVEAFGGTMAALSCSAAKARELISKVSSDDTGAYPIDIACYNAPEAVAISGPSDQIDKVISLAHAENIAGRKIRTRTPVHSSMIEICKDKYIRSVEDVFRRNGGTSNPQILTYSTCHGDLFNQPFDTNYFWNNARRPVVFQSTVETLCSRYRNAVFVEISAHPVLSAYINEVGVSVSHTLAGARRSKVPVEYRAFLQTVGQLTLAGYNSIRFDRLNFCIDANFDLSVKLPEYPFMRKSFPFYFDGPALWKQHEARNGPLNHKYLRINQRTHPWLSDHRALGEAIMPACGFVEMALEFGVTVLMEVNFRKILPTAREKPIPVHVDLDGSYWSVKSDTSGKNVDLHADGYLSFETVPCSYSMPSIDVIRSRSEHITHDEFYGSIGGLEYGPIFRRVLDMYINPSEALVKVKGYTPDLIKDGPFHVHPAILDCCIQAVEHFHGDSDPDSYYLPSRIKNVVLHKSMRNSRFPEIFYVYHNLHLWQPDSVVVNITIFDEEEVPVCTMQEFEIRRHRLIQESGVKRRYDIIYQPISLPVGSLLRDDVDKKELSHHNFTVQGMCETGNSKPLEEQGDMKKMEMMQRVLQRTLASIALAPGRVINIIFLTTDGDSLHSQVSAIFDHHRSFYVNYFISNGSNLTVTTWNTTARIGALSLDQPIANQGFSPKSFDLLYLIEPENFEAIPFSVIIQTAQSLLTDMGHLFLIGTESHMPGWVSCLTQRGFERLGSFSGGWDQFQTAEFILHQRVAADSKDVRYVRYKRGHESDLISTLSGYDTAENCDIWIIADEGREGDEAMGLVRTIRKEFLAWNMKLAVFAASFSEECRTDFLTNFALGLPQETEIVVSSEGDVTVPRIFPLPSSDTPHSSSPSTFSRLLKGHVLVRASARSTGSAYSSFVGSVIASSSSDFTKGCTVMGITTSAEAEFAVPSLSLRPLDSLSLDAASIISRLPGLVVAVLAPTLNTFTHPRRLSQLRVLLTHATSSIGRVVRHIYRARQVDIVEVAEDITLYQLSQIGREEFDLAITGYVDPGYLQVLDLLIRRDVGRVFSWNTGHTSLARICMREPWQIGDAIEVGFSNAPLDCEFLAPDINICLPFEPSNQPLAFRPDCNYLILGGLGSLGPHIALWMYERGARHMILTSRQATTTFPPSSDRQLRIIHYLKSRSDLTLRFESFDPAKAGKIYESFSAISPPIAGCFILTAMPSDGLSLNLTSDDFKRSHSASLDVFRTLQSIVNVDEMDFLVHFSSVSALCGNAGQSSYASAKTALDGELARFRNAFAFVCPAISGTTLVNSLYSVRSASSLLSWQVSPSRMLQWLDDAMRVLSSGNEMRYYIPDWDWEDAAKTLGLPAFGTYLCPPKSAEQGSTTLNDNDRRITEVITQQLDVHPEDLSDDVSLASYGLDSLSASRLSFTLRKVFGLKISQIQLLADITTGDIRGRVAAQEKESQMASPLDRIRHEMMDRLQKYTLGSVKYVAKNTAQPAKKVVLITGTTGALGANILHRLVLDPSVGTI